MKPNISGATSASTMLGSASRVPGTPIRRPNTSNGRAHAGLRSTEGAHGVGGRRREAQQVVQVARIERGAQSRVVRVGAPAGDPGEVLGDGQFGHVRHQPGGQRQLAERGGDAVLRAQRVEFGARRLLARRRWPRGAPRGDAPSADRIGGQVVGQRDDARLARGERLVERGDLVRRPDREQEQPRRRAAPAAAARWAAAPAAARPRAAGTRGRRAPGRRLRDLVEAREAVAGTRLQLREQRGVFGGLRELLEFGDQRVGRLGPGAHAIERLRAGRRAGRAPAPWRRSRRARPVVAVAARQRLVVGERGAQVRQREALLGAAVGLELHRAGGREAVERGAQFLARGEQLEPAGRDGAQGHGGATGASRSARTASRPRRRCRSIIIRHT